MQIQIKKAVILSIVLILSLPGCKKDTPLTEQEKAMALLTSAPAWESPVVTVDGVDYSDLYSDFSITFSKDTYTTVSGAPMWAPNGTWEFLNKEATFLKLDNTLEVEINSISNEFLELSFLWDLDTFEPGRTNSVKGKQKFKLKKKKKP